MKNVWSMLLATISVCCAIEAYAKDSNIFTVQYKTYEETPGPCPTDVIDLLQNNQLIFRYASKDFDGMGLLGALGVGVTMTPLALSNEGIEGRDAYISTKDGSLTIGNDSYVVKQLYLEGDKDLGLWRSGFYLGENRTCLIETRPMPENMLKR